MKKTDRIYVAGHRGMVGGAILRALEAQGYDSIVTRTHAELELIDRAAVDRFFATEKIDHVFLAAAKVGGIMANDTQSGDFIRDNLYIQTNVIDAAYRNGAKKFMFLGSSCIYPKFAEQPIRESSLLTGELEPTNSAYAIAKIAGKEMCDAYRKQFGFNAFTVMPSNVYGVGDNFDPQSSHVAAALMRRFHEAKKAGLEKVEAWGTGSPLREFIFAGDLADACLFLMNNYKDGGMINAGSAQEVSIRELTAMIAETVGFVGEITWDASKPDGTPRKIMDSSRLRSLGWAPKTPLRDGMKQMYAWFLKNVAV
jgi:GDP-L-fucose synthase